MKYIVYLTVNKANNKIYVGVHQTNKEFDGYIGCGVDINRPSTIKHPKTPFQYAVKKYGFKNFVRLTIAEFNSPEPAFDLERQIVNQEFLEREDVYNVALGGKTHPDVLNKQKRVYMFDLDGKFLREFNGVNEAALSINPKAKNGSHISRAIKQGLVYQGYQWSYTKDAVMKKVKAKKQKSFTVSRTRKIGRYDSNGVLLEIFDTITACRKAGYQNANKVLVGDRKLCNGYSFKYLD